MRRSLIFAVGTLVLTACPAGFQDLCDNHACDDASVTADAGDSGVDAPPGCDLTKDPSVEPACVVEQVGIFVDAAKGQDSNAGTRAAPMKTIGAALGKTSTQQARLYVCAGTYPEDLLLDGSHDGVSLYGGWKCADWSFDAAGVSKPQIGKTNLAAKLSGLTRAVAVEDVYIRAADGVNPGESSLAVLVANCTNVTFNRVKLEAGKGMAGANGTLTNFTYPTQTQLNGNSATGIDGGTANTVPCPGGDSTTGGAGGYGNGADGQDGTPGPSNKGTLSACSLSGTSGGNGVVGTGGADAPAIANLGALTATAWTPTAGGPGTHGHVGQGGGGGGGYSNGGGGGGGAGGCGGAPGPGGGGGGGCIAIAVFSSTCSMNTSTLVCAGGGNGGSGVAGQPGETLFGARGTGFNISCNGGNGAVGGSGGAGAGGAGGISTAVLWKGTTQPALDTATTNQITLGMKGTKGAGGNGNDGIDGVSQAVLQSP